MLNILRAIFPNLFAVSKRDVELAGGWPDHDDSGDPGQNQRGVPVSKTEGGKLWQRILENRCPDCGAEGFYEGPSGGMSTNIRCSGEPAHWFNVTPIVGTAERIRR